VERAGAGDERRGVTGHMRGELAEVPLTAGIVKAGMAEHGFGPGLDELALRRDAGCHHGEIGVLEQLRSDFAEDLRRQVARVARAAGVDADDLEPGKSGGEPGSRAFDFLRCEWENRRRRRNRAGFQKNAGLPRAFRSGGSDAG